MVLLDDFLPRLLPYVPGCADPLAKQALLDSAIELCTEAEVIRELVDPFAVEANTATYAWEPPAYQEVASVLHVWVGTTRLTGAGDEAVTWNDDNVSQGTPRVYHCPIIEGVRVLKLAPVPVEAMTGRVEFALRPTRSALRLHDDLYNVWLDDVVAGAVARLVRIPGQPFSLPADAAEALMTRASLRFRAAQAAGNVGRGRASLRVTPRNIV